MKDPDTESDASEEPDAPSQEPDDRDPDAPLLFGKGLRIEWNWVSISPIEL